MARNLFSLLLIATFISAFGVLSALADQSKIKQTKELEERIKLLEKRAQIKKTSKSDRVGIRGLSFGTRGQFFISGVQIQATPLTEAEIEEVIESEGN